MLRALKIAFTDVWEHGLALLTVCSFRELEVVPEVVDCLQAVAQRGSAAA